eukprot:GEMP01072365.1.p1 GENE.GEMP01072365.1~~GEMP01072365.1.p1  ORF type:complete len:122 (+),score=23.29 GEMP01072365.1:285-650(+)
MLLYLIDAYLHADANGKLVSIKRIMCRLLILLPMLGIYVKMSSSSWISGSTGKKFPPEKTYEIPVPTEELLLFILTMLLCVGCYMFSNGMFGWMGDCLRVPTPSKEEKTPLATNHAKKRVH